MALTAVTGACAAPVTSTTLPTGTEELSAPQETEAAYSRQGLLVETTAIKTNPPLDSNTAIKLGYTINGTTACRVKDANGNLLPRSELGKEYYAYVIAVASDRSVEMTFRDIDDTPDLENIDAGELHGKDCYLSHELSQDAAAFTMKLKPAGARCEITWESSSAPPCTIKIVVNPY